MVVDETDGAQAVMAYRESPVPPPEAARVLRMMVLWSAL